MSAVSSQSQSVRALLLESDLFDVGFYLRCRPDVARAGLDPVEHFLDFGWKEGSNPSDKFSVATYLDRYQDVRESGVNPLLHYIQYGKAEGRDASFEPLRASDVKIPRPRAPSKEDWDGIKHDDSVQAGQAVVDVLVPVYGGYDETLGCLYSVLRAKQKTPYRLLVVNDASPEGPLVDALENLAERGLIELHTLPENRGFVGACNYGMSDALDHDVVLLNSDTEVHGDWLDRLRAAAYSQSNVATVTPFSNNAEICSYPRFVHDNWKALEIDDAELDAIASSVNAGKTLQIPTGVGFCMYIRRKCLSQIGYFDLHTFGKGYGEENDLCCRAADAGWMNILAPNVFVRHYGGASFGASKRARIAAALTSIQRLHPNYLEQVRQFIEADPVQPFREALDIGRVRQQTRRGAVLCVLHGLGGGTEDHVNDMVKMLDRAGIEALICQADPAAPDMLVIKSKKCINLPNAPKFSISTDLDAFSAYIQRLNVRHVHIHHLAGFLPEANDFFRLTTARLGIRYDVTLHDYTAVCPRVTMIDGSGQYCGEPSPKACEACIQRNGSQFGKPSVWEWRERYGRLFDGARRVFVPDEDVAHRLRRYFPETTFTVKPHFELPSNVVDNLPMGRNTLSKRRIALLGAIGPHKGSELLEKTASAARDMELPLEFYIVGYTDRDRALTAIGNVYITGKYHREDAAQLLMEANADLVFFSSVCPETYSYTLTTALATNHYPVSFDIGAISRRIKSLGRGATLPLELMGDPRQLALELLQMPVPGQSLQARYAGMQQEYDDILRDYYEFEDGQIPEPAHASFESRMSSDGY